jgi:hypothetical protein
MIISLRKVHSRNTRDISHRTSLQFLTELKRSCHIAASFREDQLIQGNQNQAKDLRKKSHPTSMGRLSTSHH